MIMMMKRGVKMMNRRTALREINEKTLDLLVSALKKLKKDNTQDFTAKDISKLTGNYVLPKTIADSIINDSRCYSPSPKERLSLIGKACIKAFPGQKVKLKESYHSKREVVVYTSEDGERFEKEKSVHTYYFSYED